jgi:hypothetical protein
MWRQYDRHQDAYRALLTPRASEMIRRLNLSPPDIGAYQPAHEEVRCLACHTTPELAITDQTPPTAALIRQRAEGVSCVACHVVPGSAPADWFDQHARGATATWFAPRHPQLKGLRDLATSTNRAAVCVGCHVGAPADEANRLPVRDMPHDFIAAGHPRLLFDYATYVEAMPRHWAAPPPNDAGAAAPFDELTVGRQTVWKGEVELLRDRLARGGGVADFAELECAGCHHDLREPSPRQVYGRKGRVRWFGLDQVERFAPRGSAPRQAAQDFSDKLGRFKTINVTDLQFLEDWSPPSLTIDGPIPGNDWLPAWEELTVDSGAPTVAWRSWEAATRLCYDLSTMERIGRRWSSVDQAANPSVPATERPKLAALRRYLIETCPTDQPRAPATTEATAIPTYDPAVCAAKYRAARQELMDTFDAAGWPPRE